MVVLVFGASGSGKSTLMEQLMTAGSQYSVHIKGTDRSPREYDGVEIQCVKEVSPSEYDYIYQTYGYRYGIQRSQIEQAINQKRHHFIICNDISTIRAIKRDYEQCVRVVFHYFDAPYRALRSIQASRNISDDEIELRLAKTDVLYRTYLEEDELFDAVLYNHYSETPNKMRERMEVLLERMTVKTPSDSSSEQIISRIIADLEEQLTDRKLGRTGAVEPDYAFIMMAMSEDPFLEDVHATIKNTCQKLGLRAERVDDIEFTGQITEKILGSIQIAQIIIADLTYERPNVYYEIGYAHAFGKPLILVARSDTKVHFDVQGMRILYYENMTKLEKYLTKTITSLLPPTE